jgi:site-specific DNA-methyltransferase (adenine-specific)
MEHINTNLIVEGYSPRRDFSRKEELKRSIEKENLLEPLTVRQHEGNYIIIAGVRRFRIIKELGWKTVPCVIQDVNEKTAAHLSYVSNSEGLRKNLNPIEVSLHIKEMREKFGYSVQDLVDLRYAKDDQTIYNKLNLLNLPKDVQEKIAKKEITPTEGYRIGAIKDSDLQSKVIDTVCGMKERSTRKTQKVIRDLIDSVNHEKDITHQVPEIPQGDIPGVFIKDASDMSELKDKSVGLIVTSPPYWVGMDYEEGVSFEEHIGILRKVLSECVRVLVPSGKVCVNFGDIHNFGTRKGERPEIKLMGHHYADIFGKHGLRLVGIITWKKCTPGKRDFNWSANPHVNYHQGTKHTSYRVLNNTEYIYIFEKEGQREVPFDIEHESKISKEEWTSWVDGVWEIPPVRGEKGHPAPFPEELVRRLILMYSHKRDIVLDCFGGTMTTVKVANALGRIGIGYEKEEKYKPVIMKKLGVKEEDLKKPQDKENRGAQGGTPHFIAQFESTITEILKEEGKIAKDIASVRISYKGPISKDDIAIQWVCDPGESDPPESDASPPVMKADGYEAKKEGEVGPKILLPVCIENKQSGGRLLDSIILGDCMEKLKDHPDNSVDLVATDPPYGLKFMGKDWDKAVPGIDVWKECLRVMKPGAFAFVMCTPRQDCLSRMVFNLERAGFQTNFSPIYWTYAQGFPKAHNVGKQVEDLKGAYGGFQPKPAVEVIIVAMKPTDKGTYVDQALDNGKGITWLDDCRIPYKDDKDNSNYDKSCDVNGKYETGLTWGGKKVLDIPKAGRRTRDYFNGEGSHESWNASAKGRFPANLLISDDVLDTGKEHPGGGVGGRSRHGRGRGYGFKPMGESAPDIPKDRGGYSRLFCLDSWAEKNLPFLIVPKASKKEKNAGCESIDPRNVDRTKLAMKCKKCGKYPISSNRNNRCQCENPEWIKTKQQNFHPTVKPIKLMSYLITMGSREGELVLDPFCGSGSTCVAAKLLNRKFIGIELDQKYHEIAEARVKNAEAA